MDIWLFTNSRLCQFIEIVHKIINEKCQNNYLSMLYKHIIQVEIKNAGLKGGDINIPMPPPPPIKKKGGTLTPPLPPPPPTPHANAIGKRVGHVSTRISVLRLVPNAFLTLFARSNPLFSFLNQ